jgi:hypothetical protein
MMRMCGESGWVLMSEGVNLCGAAAGKPFMSEKKLRP